MNKVRINSKCKVPSLPGGIGSNGWKGQFPGAEWYIGRRTQRDKVLSESTQKTVH